MTSVDRHPSVPEDVLLAGAAQRAARYVRALGQRPVVPTAQAVAALDQMDVALGADGLSSEEVLSLLDEVGSPATLASAGPRYFGFVTGGALPVAVAASWLLAAWDQNNALAVMSPVASRLDAVALRWACELLRLPPSTTGSFVSGATLANATCLAAARDAALARAGWDSASDGLVGAPPVQVVVGDEAHSSLFKALGLVGLGRGRALRLPVDDQGRVIARDLPRLSGPAIVCFQAGNVNSGASDPFAPLIQWAHEQGAWAHVDGAFGLWARACPSLADQVEGVEAADSWATDAHKWLNTTYDCGIALVNDETALRQAMKAEAAYLPVGPARDPMSFGPHASQRARGVEVWAVLAHLGRRRLADMVARHCQLARRLASGLAEAGADVLNEVVLNQVVVSFGDAWVTDAVVQAVQQEGTCWCGPTTWRGQRAMRASVSNWSTTEDDIDMSVASILRAMEAERR